MKSESRPEVPVSSQKQILEQNQAERYSMKQAGISNDDIQRIQNKKIKEDDILAQNERMTSYMSYTDPKPVFSSSKIPEKARKKADPQYTENPQELEEDHGVLSNLALKRRLYEMLSYDECLKAIIKYARKTICPHDDIAAKMLENPKMREEVLSSSYNIEDYFQSLCKTLCACPQYSDSIHPERIEDRTNELMEDPLILAASMQDFRQFNEILNPQTKESDLSLSF